MKARRKKIAEEEARKRREGLLSDEDLVDDDDDGGFVPHRLRKKEKVCFQCSLQTKCVIVENLSLFMNFMSLFIYF